MSPSKPAHSSGFTLIEVLIAMAIFAILAALSYAGLQSVIDSKTSTEAELNRLAQLQLSMHNITGDLEQIAPRDGHDALGGVLYNVTNQSADSLIELTRRGWRNFANQPRSTLQRVAYRLDEDKLVRIYWLHVDRADDEQKVEKVLMENISELSFRFLNAKNEWKDNWPSADRLVQSGGNDLPKAIEVNIELGDWGEITRMVQVTQR